MAPQWGHLFLWLRSNSRKLSRFRKSIYPSCPHVNCRPILENVINTTYRLVITFVFGIVLLSGCESPTNETADVADSSAAAESFDIREFHDAVLRNGAVPLPILERVVEQYIAKVKASD